MKILKKKTALCMVLLFILMLISIPVNALSAQAYAVIDIQSGRLLHANNATTPLEMASTTKIMTCIVAIETSDLDEIVLVDDRAVGTEGSSIYLKHGEEIRLGDLLYGLMLQSGNDAANAIAYYISGDIASFSAKMNAKAREIGALNTNFVNPSGLSDANHYTTAEDLAKICAYAMRNETFAAIVSTRNITIPALNAAGIDRTITNKNRLLSLYEGATGIKTGYTKSAGKCFCGSAERDGFSLAVVTLNTADTFTDAIELLDQAYADYTQVTFLTRGEYLKSIPIDTGGTKRLYAPQDLTYPLLEDEIDDVRIEITTEPILHAPMSAGEKIGQIELFIGSELQFTLDITLDKDIEYKQTFLDKILSLFKENI